MRKYLIIISICISPIVEAQNWPQLGTNIFDGGGNAANDRFGEFTAISGDGTIVAGSSRFQSEGGYVRAYQYDGSSWNQIGQTISGTKAFPDLDYIGRSVSLSGTGARMSVGSSLFDNNSLSSNGKVAVYQYNSVTDNWDLFGNELFGTASDDFFGQASVLSEGGSILAVGAPKTGSANGYVKVYNYSANTTSWTQRGSTLQSSIANDGDGFGSVLALSNAGDVIAIGAPRGKTAGYVQVFEFTNNTWTQKGQDLDGGQAGEEFGTSVSMDATGSNLIVGAPSFDNGSGVRNGRVKVFEWNTTTSQWDQVGSDIVGFSNDGYEGTAVSMSDDGNTISYANKRSGSTRIIVAERDGTSFQTIGNALQKEQTDSNFGSSHQLDASGDRIVAGAPFFDITETNMGRVAVFEAPEVNQIPTDITLTNTNIDEELAAGTVVGTLSTADGNAGDTHTYSISGADAASFDISGSDLVTAAILDYETQSSYNITITTDDGNGGTFDKSFTITLNNINEVALQENFNSTADGSLPSGWDGTATVSSGSVSLSGTTTLITPAIDNLRRGRIKFRLQGGNSSIKITIRNLAQQELESFGFNSFFSARNIDFNLVKDDISLPLEQLQIVFEAASGTVNVDDVVVEVPTPGDPIITNFDPYDISTAMYAGTSSDFSVDAQVSNVVNDIVFSSDGLKMFIIDESLDAVLEYALSEAYDITTAVYAGDEEQFSVTTQSATPRGLAFNQNGSKMFVGGAKNVAEYSLSANFDVSTATFSGEAEKLSVNAENIYGITFNNDGSKLFVVADVDNGQGVLEGYVIRYNLTTPYDISTAEVSISTLVVESEGSFPFDIAFNDTGTRLFIYEATSTLLINEYDLTTAFDLTTATYAGTDEQFLIPTDIVANKRGFVFDGTGRRIFMIGGAEQIIKTFNLIPKVSFDENNDGVILDIDANDGFGGENDAPTYTLQGTDAALFSINVAGEITFNEAPDFENPADADSANTYDIIVRASNSFGTTDQYVQIIVNDIEENSAPTDITLSDSTVNENTETIGTLSTTDPDAGDTHSYSVSGNLFGIRNGNELFVSGGLNYEANSNLTVSITSDDGNGGTFSKAFTITVIDINEAPTSITLSATSIQENQGIGSQVGTLSATDPDANDTIGYSLSGADAASFSIDGNLLKTAEVFDFETKNSFSIDITATDAGDSSFTQNFTITITDQEPENSLPTDISLSQTAVDENTETIATLSTTDPDAGDTHTYTVSGDTFSIVNGNQLTVSGGLNFEEQSGYSVEITTTDNNGGSFTKTFTITVNDINEAPTGITAESDTIQENQVEGTPIMIFTTEDEDANDTHTYTLGGADSGLFAVEGDTLISAAVFDFETKNSYSVEVTTTDAGGLSFTRNFTIFVTDQESENSIPTAIDLSSTSVEENEAEGTLVGTLSTTDADPNDSHVYSLAGEDAASFALDGADLLTAESFDFETKSSYLIDITTDDGKGGVFTGTFTISVIDLDDDVLSVKEDLQIMIYPNPSADRLFINSAEKIRSVKLIDMDGKVIETAGGKQQFSIDVSHISTGTYLLIIETALEKSTKRVIIR